MKILSTFLLVPLDDTVVFPNMNVTISADVGDEKRVLLVPRHDGEYAKVGTVAEVAERVRLPGGIGAVSLVGLHRGIAGAAHTDPQGRLRVEVQEQPDENPPGMKTRELEREYRAVVEEILELRGDDGESPPSYARSVRLAHSPTQPPTRRRSASSSASSCSRQWTWSSGSGWLCGFSASAWPSCRSGSGSARTSKKVLSASSASTSCAVSWSRSAR